jgi:hypothetical protein
MGRQGTRGFPVQRCLVYLALEDYMTRGERLVAFETLLAKPDETSLRRGHHFTCSGDPRRLQERWLPGARIWIGHRLGRIEGWIPARRAVGSAIFSDRVPEVPRTPAVPKQIRRCDG